MNEKEQKTINSIRLLGIDMINEAGSGHPGIVLGAAPIIYTLYAYHLNILPNNDKWFNRDRFILSAGHGSALLYATLFMAGFNMTIDDLKKFRSIDSITPGHPELGITPGVEMSTGPLGQGIATAVGIALGERYLENLIDREIKNQKLIDYYTYVLCGDGDLMEGIANEAMSFAGTQKLGKLIVLYDSNDVCLDGKTNMTFNENILKKYEAMGWQTIYVKNGENINEINKAIEKAKSEKNKPTLIEVKTIIGFGSNHQGENSVHGKPLEQDDIENIKNKYNLRDVPFTVSKDGVEYFRSNLSKRCNIKYSAWAEEYARLKNLNNENLNKVITFLEKNNLNIELDTSNFKFEDDFKEELRETNQKILNIISSKSDFFIGGSADLSSSCKTYLLNAGDMSYDNPMGKNIFFGVREHAMGAILNGLALAGFRPFGSTFLTFSDYLKPAIRMSALMNLPVTYIFTHDSIAIGEDGPTHQPIEQLGSLRLIPNLTVFRPADVNEVLGMWQVVLESSKPNALVINKNVCEVIKGTDINSVKKGAYIIRKEIEKIDGIILATGSEVKYASLIAEDLFNKGFDIRVVSVPSIELFISSGRTYQEAILPIGSKIIAMESSNDNIWNRFVYDSSYIINVNEFGYSGKKDDVLKKFDFDYENLKQRVEKLLR